MAKEAGQGEHSPRYLVTADFGSHVERQQCSGCLLHGSDFLKLTIKLAQHYNVRFTRLGLAWSSSQNMYRESGSSDALLRKPWQIIHQVVALIHGSDNM